MDSTFKVLKPTDERSEEYQAYRTEWDRRGRELDPGVGPVHLDIETSAVCDLRCGSTEADPKGFCQIWTHEHTRTLGFAQKTWKPGLMDPKLYRLLIKEAERIGVKSVKLNYRGEPSLHPQLIRFVALASDKFVDVMLNTNGNGGARKKPDFFVEIVDAGIINLMFSVDACTPETYRKQRVGGDWSVMLHSVSSACEARAAGKGHPDCRIRASVVRTKMNAADVDSGRMERFWLEQGVDWVSISECYFPGGVSHPWAQSMWTPMTPAEFQCADPFRRMIVTWNGMNTFPCCQGFPGAVDGGHVFKGLLKAWHSPAFAKMRNSHVGRTWEKESMCRSCPLSHKPTTLGIDSFTV